MSPIVFNGKSYSSVDEMPADVRQAYEHLVGIFADKDRDGIPDIFEGAAGTGGIGVQSLSISFNKAQVIVDGKAYSSVEEMPGEVRRKYEQAMAEVGQMLRNTDQDNVPDILEGILSPQSVASASQVMPEPATTTRRSILGSASPVVADATPRVGSLLLIGVVVAVLMVVIGGLVLLVLFR